MDRAVEVAAAHVSKVAERRAEKVVGWAAGAGIVDLGRGRASESTKHF